ncbi:MAG: threonine/serine dehydratase [Gemmatimonadetes bacterium]|nr:threonine/serine dehydratase [Gemmatimonadota bacterium]MYC90226.1 threonine/serine dehydratase [Gemmatimonadota bacterium]
MSRVWSATMTTSSDRLVPLAEIEAAAGRIRGTVVRTPLIPDPDLSEAVGGEIRLKCESLQKAGAFKARGACNFMARLTPEELARGVITYSSGNHAQAVAFAAGLKGVRAVVVMPTTAPRVKSDGARRLGARVEFAGTTSEHRRVRAEEIAAAEGLVMVPPFDHPWIIAGAGTVALEVFEDWPEVDTLLVPIGGGGQMAGCAAALRRLKPEASVIGVEPAGAPTMRRALDAGGPSTLPGIDTIADGLAPTRAGDLTYAHAAAFLDDVVLVEDDDIRRAAAHLLTRRKLVVEYSGAATIAALTSGRVDARGRNVCAVISGGNLDTSLLGDILAAAPDQAA